MMTAIKVSCKQGTARHDAVVPVCTSLYVFPIMYPTGANVCIFSDMTHGHEAYCSWPVPHSGDALCVRLC